MGIVFFHKNTRIYKNIVTLYLDYLSRSCTAKNNKSYKINSLYTLLLFINTFNCDSVRQFIIKTAIREPDNILHSSNNTGLFDTTYDGSIMYYHTLYIPHLNIFVRYIVFAFLFNSI